MEKVPVWFNAVVALRQQQLDEFWENFLSEEKMMEKPDMPKQPPMPQPKSRPHEPPFTKLPHNVPPVPAPQSGSITKSTIPKE